MTTATSKGSAKWLKIVLVSVVLGVVSPSAHACMGAVGPGYSIEIAHEDALIVWYAARHREDFIRRADFQTNAHDFGFLVPVPSTPTLTAVHDNVFDILHHIAFPEVKNVPIGQTGGGFAGGGGGDTQVLTMRQ